MSQVEYSGGIHHLGEELLQDMAVRVRVNAIIKNDPSVTDTVTYLAARDAAIATVQADVDAEIAFHDTLAPLAVDLHAATEVTDTTAAKAAINSALGARAVAP